VKLLPATTPAPILGVAIPGNHEAATYYRIQTPLRAIAPEGGWVTLGEGTDAHRAAARVVVVSRFSGDADYNLGAIRGYQARGVRVLFDYDDDPDSIPVSHLSPEKRRLIEVMRVLMRAVDGIVTTNSTLAARLRRYSRDVRVLPNYIWPDDWPEPAPLPAGPPVVTLTGSSSHVNDWRIALPTVADAVAGGVTLRVAGYLPPYLAPLCADHRPWAQGLGTYPAMLAGTHIGLCPLPRTAFNVCKSPIKLYELALSGAAVIGSPTQYGPVLEAAGLAHAVALTPSDWRRALARYLADPDLRSADAATLRAFVLTTFDARRHTDTIRAAYAA
jgi:glycosyltransferase involved in cell wall biosynthesis